MTVQRKTVTQTSTVIDVKTCLLGCKSHYPKPFPKSVITNCYQRLYIVDRDSSVGIATRYVLDGQGTVSRWGPDYPHCPERLWGLSSLLFNGDRVYVPRMKCPGRGVKKLNRHTAIPYSFFGPSWPVLR